MKKTFGMKVKLRYKKIIGSVYFSANDEVFHGKLIGISDI